MSAPAVNVATFRALQESAGADFVAELVDAFLEEAPRMLDALTVAQRDRNVEAFRRTAHSLKSNSLTFGADALGAIARELELTASTAAAGGEADLASLKREYDRVAAALVGLRDG
jgi:HPt (histidine-containing phosphotransfer) domain-containing protein